MYIQSSFAHSYVVKNTRENEILLVKIQNIDELNTRIYQEVYIDPCQKSKIDSFGKIVNG